MLSACLRHVWPTAAAAADDSGDGFDNISRMVRAGQVFRHRRNQRHPPVRLLDGQRHDARLQFLFQHVREIAQPFRIKFLYARRNHLHAVNLPRLLNKRVGLHRRQFHFQPLDFAFLFFRSGEQFFNPRNDLFGGRFQRKRGMMNLLFRLLHVRQRRVAGQRLDAPNARRDAAFAEQLEQADFAGGSGMRPATQFHAQARNLHDAHLFAVFVLKKGERAHVKRLIQRGFRRLHDGIRANAIVHDGFDTLRVLAVNRGKVDKIEAETLRRDERSGLLDMIA